MQEKDIEKDARRGSVGGKLRGSISVQHVSEMDVKEGQVYSMNDVDPALDAKMRLVNQVRGLHFLVQDVAKQFAGS